eukprot:comp25539_c0_seq1/m.47003 comp25539_c0_seq1/g.47003  ORF comp25539_c0_seq1/g.47003 comp25539_c0_seq1/m.47003 type:complete len:102 (-) comp25539_c0_seq1:170-475(-)
MSAKLFLAVGFLLLINSAYSAIQHRRYLSLMDEPFKHLPNDIFYQTMGAFALVLFGIAGTAGDFQNIHDLSNMPAPILKSRTNFSTFNHRGRVLYNRMNVS